MEKIVKTFSEFINEGKRKSPRRSGKRLNESFHGPTRVSKKDLVTVEIDWISSRDLHNNLEFSRNFLASEEVSSPNSGSDAYYLTGHVKDLLKFMAKHDYISSVAAEEELEDFIVNVISDEFHIVDLDIVDFDEIKNATCQMGIGFKRSRPGYDGAWTLIGNEIALEEWFRKFYDGEDYLDYVI